MSDPNHPDPIPGDDVSAGSGVPASAAFESSLAGAGTPSLREADPRPEPTREETRTTVRVRRSPKISGFALAGVMVGVIVALVLTFAFPEDEEFAPTQVFGFLLIFSAIVFGALGAVVALIVEAASRKRARTIEADRQVTTGDTDD